MSPATQPQDDVSSVHNKLAPRKRQPWWRAYDGLPRHPRWRVVARKSGQPVPCVVAVVVSLLDHASAARDRGDVSAFDAEICAASLDMDDDAVARIVAALKDNRWIANGLIVTWDDRQVGEEDPTAADRQRAKRARDAAAVRSNVTASHGDVTGLHGEVTPSHGRGEERRSDQTREDQSLSSPRGDKNRRASRLPDDWSLCETDEAFGKQKGLSPAEIYNEAEKFANYWHGKAGQGAVKADWASTWRNWVLNAVEKKGTGAHGVSAAKFTPAELRQAGGDLDYAARRRAGRAG